MARHGRAPIALEVPAATLAEFDRDGHVRLPGVLTAAEVAGWRSALTTFVATGGVTPGGTLHLGDLGDRTDLGGVVHHPAILTVVRHHLGDDFELNEAVCRAPAPGHGAQSLHQDWAGPVTPGDWWVCNAIVALGEIGADDGATRIVSGSHVAPDWGFRASGPQVSYPGEGLLTLAAGDAGVFSGHLLHAGSENRGTAPRYALLITYRRRGTASPPG